MSGTRRTYRRNSPEAAARVIAAMIARDGRLDAIDDRTTQLIVAARLLYLAEIDGVQAEERELVRRAWERWRVTPQILEREMKIPLALSRAVGEPAAVA